MDYRENWKDCTVIFGGTFDPPHIGHRQAAVGLLENPGVKEVWVVPDGERSSQKAPQTSSDHRWEMVKSNFSNLQRVQVLNTAIEFNLVYSFDLISELKRIHHDLAFCVGADQWLNLNTWHRFPEILKVCRWIVLARQNSDKQKAKAQIDRWRVEGILPNHYAILVETPAMEVSSSQIRHHLAVNQPVDKLLQPEVYQYLKAHGLYGSGEKQ